jgi:hypothetical protein
MDFVSKATILLFLDGEVPSKEKLRRTSQSLLEDAQLNLMSVIALRLSPEFDNFIREGYCHDSFIGTRGDWTRDSGIEAMYGYFWCLDRLRVPRYIEIRPRLISDLHHSSN